MYIRLDSHGNEYLVVRLQVLTAASMKFRIF
jgi:hypothetical protein